MSRLNPRDSNEHSAAALVAHELGALGACRRDDGTRDNMRDFDLLFEDGRAEPLEVTIHADPFVIQSWARLDRHEPSAEDGLARAWFVSVDYPTSGPLPVEEVRAEIIEVLRMFEAVGVTKFETAALVWGEQPELRDGARRLSARGVPRGSSLVPPADRDPGLYINTGSGGVVAPDSITRAVEEEAAKLDNQKKLGPAGTPRSHLAVLLSTAGRGLELHALRHQLEGSFHPPPAIPVLPPEISCAWALAGDGGIYVAPPEDWVIFHAPEGLWERPPPLLPCPN